MRLLITGLLITMAATWGINLFQKNLEDFMFAQASIPLQELTDFQNYRKLKRPPLELNVKAAASIKIKNNKDFIILKRNWQDQLAIASLTKLMTSTIVLANPQDFDFSKIITISRQAARQDDVPMAGNLRFGEKLSIKELLDLMLIYSSNDAAMALAETPGKDKFIEKMNLKAQEIGLFNTHFINPTGLDPEDLRYDAENKNEFNFSTAEDLAALTKYILKNYPLIFEITASGGPLPTTNGISGIIAPENLVIWGGKTGYTDEAGGCMILVTFTPDGDAIINVILGAASAEERVQEMQKLVDWTAK